MLLLHSHFVSLPLPDTPLASRILDDDKYYPFFEDCLGALDGTHIPIHVPSLSEQAIGIGTKNVPPFATLICNLYIF